MTIKKPIYRRLRVFTLDPGMAARMGTAFFNEVVIRIPWESLDLGPKGEYVAVLDEDDSGNQLFDPVDLDNPHVLANNGLTPSDGNPQFHQQMVYAVAMRTIRTYEKALGRRVQWTPIDDKFTQQLILRPHGLKEANAHFHKNVINFGYVQASPKLLSPYMMVFACLSQDVIAHLVSHAILNAMFFKFEAEKDNRDARAFLEGFCDTVALLQRLSLKELLSHQLALTRGDLDGPSQLGILASQFAEALGMRSGLRSAFGEFDQDGKWNPTKPGPEDYQNIEEPHKRGEILMRAIFDALNRIYISRVADLKRIATEGAGILPEGELHPDLINRFAVEAAKSAGIVLNMCIRALDYCPSVNITFGDYLRAIITADFDLVPVDVHNYRVAFVEAFLRYGIFPANVSTLSIETLLWPILNPKSSEASLVRDFILKLAGEYSAWNLPWDRKTLFELTQDKARELEQYLSTRKNQLKKVTGIDPKKPFRVHSIWPRECVSPCGEPLSQWIIQIIQILSDDQGRVGCTLVVNADTGLIRYALRKRSGETIQEQKPRNPLNLLSNVTISPPVERRLRVFALDPSLASQMETVHINQVTLRIPWEKEIGLGPVGKYLEVVDYDPSTGCFYDPVNLNDKYLIAEDGLTPSQGNPQFHQQMVYAVAMRTIRNFELALGRLALWSSHWEWDKHAEDDRHSDPEKFVQHLRLYPHALREANAFYSPDKKAVLFGYFQTPIGSIGTPVTIFTCLSHDIIVHELTHALLDGMHRRFAEPSNPDVLAFHEAFADLVALFQHFSLPEVLENQIAVTRGDLANQNRLGELAQEFGHAIGNRGALRSAIGEYDKSTGEWRPKSPDPEAYLRDMEPHTRGSLLVAAVFDAFLTLYRSKIVDLFRIATKGRGILPAGQLHPDLIRRLAIEAADSAQGILEMCIRALDYFPPIDITFGDYLRAVITADFEFDPVDEHNRRIAFIEAFRRHGILPQDVRAFSLEGLLWPQANAMPNKNEELILDLIKNWTNEIKSWNLSQDREELFNMMVSKRRELHDFLNDPKIKESLKFLNPELKFEVHALRPSARIDFYGKSHLQWIVEITQSIPDFLDAEKAKRRDAAMAKAKNAKLDKLRKAKSDYRFRGGATLLVDAETGKVRYSIEKPLQDPRRRERQRIYLSDSANRSLYATYFKGKGVQEQEPFAVLHRF